MTNDHSWSMITDGRWSLTINYHWWTMITDEEWPMMINGHGPWGALGLLWSPIMISSGLILSFFIFFSTLKSFIFLRRFFVISLLGMDPQRNFEQDGHQKCWKQPHGERVMRKKEKILFRARESGSENLIIINIWSSSKFDHHQNLFIINICSSSSGGPRGGLGPARGQDPFSVPKRSKKHPKGVQKGIENY